MNWFLYKLIPPRADFASTLSPAEGQAMSRHFEYWGGHLASGRVLIFTPVADPRGDWGLAIVQADSADDVRALGDADPAVESGVARYEVLQLPGAVTGNG